MALRYGYDVAQKTFRFVNFWASFGPRFLPFADIATPDLTLWRLLRLSMFQASVGMAMVLLVGTLNRVMIVELGVPATIVGVMIALPVISAPFRALIGYRSDTHRSQLGWRRVPFIWQGTLMQFGGFAIMPFALLVLAGKGEAANAPMWIGQAAAAVSFLLVGAGVHTVQTAGLALATDLTPPESHAKVVGLMYIMLLVSTIVSALIFGAWLVDFTPGRLVQVIQGAAVVTIALNIIAMWKQETRDPPRGRPEPAPDPTFGESWALFCQGKDAVRRLIIIGLGTMAFGMAEILLEPFGGQVLNFSVASTTKLTALLAFGGLLGFSFAARTLGRGGDPYRMTAAGVLIGLPAFGLVIASAPMNVPWLFLIGNFMIGFGAALFGHGTLTATMSGAPKEQAGLALGAWGAVQATAAGVAIALSGIMRDVVNALLAGDQSWWLFSGPSKGYVAVYLLEILLLLLTLAVIIPMVGRLRTPVAALNIESAATVTDRGTT